jgi:transposase
VAWRKLTPQQWEAIRVHLPETKVSARGGRPRVDDRCCFEGILWILWTGTQWGELPRRYGSPSTCWRRLKQWEESGVLLTLWRAFLAQLNDEQKLRWDECFVDGSFIPAKKGAQGREGYKVDGAGRWRGYSAGSRPGRGVPGGGHAPRKDP